MLLGKLFIAHFPNKEMKSLKPSMREKNRYLLVKGKNLKKNVEDSTKDFLGILGVSKMGLRWIKKKDEKAIISVNREMVDALRASFCIWSERIIIERISGSLKNLKKDFD
jgi:RNase P/RNase MRP subunit POP5